MVRESSTQSAPAGLRGGSSAAADGIDFPTLLAHLAKLGQGEAAANAADAAAADHAASKNASLLPEHSSPDAATPSEKNAMFARDSAHVRERMRHFVEAQLADALVVSSAATLAVRFLKRRYRYPALLSRAQSTGVSSGTDSASQRRRGRGHRRQRSASAGVLSDLLAVTCLHLASKYHCVEALEARAFAIRSPHILSEVFSLGYDISLSMGAALNASFRANPCSLQSLFCYLADAPAVVRACSEWFALCLVLLLDPSCEETCPTPPSQQHSPHVFSPTPSTATVPITPASQAASTTAASPASTATLPITPASSSITGITGSSLTPISGGGGGDVLLHHDQFSRATILGLGSLVLGRRLARSRGPCLPIQVQEALGLQDHDALDLVTEGVCVARKAFETETPPDDNEEEGHSRNPGKAILAGVAVFERGVVSSSGITRTLLEWVTDGEEDGAVPTTSPHFPGKAAAAHNGESPPDFVQGTALSCAAAGGAIASFRPGDRLPSSRNPSRTRGLGSSADSGGGGSSSSTGSDTTSDLITRGSRVGKRALPARGDSSAGELEARTAPSTTGSGKSDAGESSSAPSSSEASSVSTAGERESLLSSGGGACTTGVLGKEFSPPPSSSIASTPIGTRRHDVDDNSLESNGDTPGSSSPGGAAFAGSPAQSSVSGAASLECGGYTASNDEPLTRKRVAPDQADSDRSSQGAWGVGSKRPRRAEDDGSSSATLTSPRRRKAGTYATPASSSPEQREKNARWEVLIDRVLAALDDHCGCSFCKLRDGGGHHGGDGAVRSSAKQVPTPAAPSPRQLLYSPPREPPNSDEYRGNATATSPTPPAYPPFTPPGPPPAAPVRGSPNFQGLPSARADKPLSRPHPVEEAQSDGRRRVAAEELMGRERPTAGEEGGCGAKRSRV